MLSPNKLLVKWIFCLAHFAARRLTKEFFLRLRNNSRTFFLANFFLKLRFLI